MLSSRRGQTVAPLSPSGSPSRLAASLDEDTNDQSTARRSLDDRAQKHNEDKTPVSVLKSDSGPDSAETSAFVSAPATPASSHLNRMTQSHETPEDSDIDLQSPPLPPFQPISPSLFVYPSPSIPSRPTIAQVSTVPLEVAHGKGRPGNLPPKDEAERLAHEKEFLALFSQKVAVKDPVSPSPAPQMKTPSVKREQTWQIPNYTQIRIKSARPPFKDANTSHCLPHLKLFQGEESPMRQHLIELHNEYPTLPLETIATLMLHLTPQRAAVTYFSLSRHGILLDKEHKAWKRIINVLLSPRLPEVASSASKTHVDIAEHMLAWVRVLFCNVIPTDLVILALDSIIPKSEDVYAQDAAILTVCMAVASLIRTRLSFQSADAVEASLRGTDESSIKAHKRHNGSGGDQAIFTQYDIKERAFLNELESMRVGEDELKRLILREMP